jgi:lysophospholipase L1-like esterase
MISKIKKMGGSFSIKSSKPENSTKYIFAFGDSLTKGYYCRGAKYHPYTIMMNNLFQQNKLPYKVVGSGINGEKSSEMIDRIKEEFDNSSYKFELVIIFAGTNDLGPSDAETIAQNIISIYKNAAEKGLPSIIATLPENEFDTLAPKYSLKRQKLNELIRSFPEMYSDISICDLEKEMPYLSRTEKERKIYWDDSLHFTPAGYDELGRILYDIVKSKFNL